MLLARGLGLGAIDPTTGAIITKGQVTPYAEKFWTVVEIKAMQHAFEIDLGQRLAFDAQALTSTLQPCPASSHFTQNYGGKPVDFCYRGAPWSAYTDTAVPGTFVAYGVAFRIDEIKNGRYDRAFPPDDDQRRMFELQIFIRSQQRQQTELRLGNLYIANPAALSVDAITGSNPNLMTYVVNFSLNPIQPTVDERTTQGGFGRWIARGGYFILRDIVTGKAAAFSDNIMLSTCMSILCACGTAPSCIRAGIGKDGVSKNPDDTYGGWKVYMAIDPHLPGNFHLALIYDDPAWYTKMGTALGHAMESLAGLLCGSAPITKELLNSAVAEKCIDAKGVTCIKGKPGCKCSKPPSSAQASVNLLNFSMQTWCAGWSQEYQQPPPEEPPSPIQPPQPFKAWWLVVGGGVLAGMLYYAKKHA